MLGTRTCTCVLRSVLLPCFLRGTGPAVHLEGVQPTTHRRPPALLTQTAGCLTDVCLCPDRSDRFFANGILDPTAGHINYFPDYFVPELSIDDFCRMFAERYLCTDDADPELRGRTLTSLWEQKKREIARRIDERDARTLHSYTVECLLYKEVNAAMRTACLRRLRSHEFKPHLDYIYHLDRALPSAVILPEHITTLYRGIKRKVSRQHYCAGKSITWQAFSSTSEKLEVALEFACSKEQKRERRPGGTVFLIEMVKSAKGISDWSQYPREAEWLFGFNTQLRVQDHRVAEQEVAPHRQALHDQGWDTARVDFILLYEV